MGKKVVSYYKSMKIRNISDDSNSLELICVDLWGDLLPTSLAKYLTHFLLMYD